MAAGVRSLPFAGILFVVVFLLLKDLPPTSSSTSSASPPSSFLVGCYARMFSFGDSLTDTGNVAKLVGPKSPLNILHPPFGDTFFRRPTGRYCDGRLVVDFIAEALGLPFLGASLAGKTRDDFRHGANFAVGGAIAVGDHHVNLSTQLQWFKDLLKLQCHDESDCRQVMASSLFLVGEIGGNNYNYLLLGRRPLAEVEAVVPSVIAAISSAVKDLIQMGAKTLIVPGNLPIGCVPKYLTYYRSSDTRDYDPKTGCLKWMNEFSVFHNRELVAALDILRSEHPDATIIYADYFGAMMELFADPHRFGVANPLVACCGAAEGPYNCSMSVECGTPGATVCDDPRKFVSWDGFHPTEAAYRAIAQGVLGGAYAHPSISGACAGDRELEAEIALEALEAAKYDNSY